MKELAWHTDENGVLLGARVHDGHVLAFAFSSEGSLRLEVRRISGQAVRFDLSNVREMNIVELWDGAILSGVYAWKAGSVPETTWTVPDSGWSALFRNRLSPPHARSAAHAIAARQPEPWLYQVECSYGGTIAAVCGGIRVYEE